MEHESFECDLVSWEEAYNLSRDLASMIKASGYRPDVVIAIGRGGYVPARVVCDFMMLKMLTSMKIEHWDVAAEKQKEAKVRIPLAVGVKSLKVLIVDDVTDTGETLYAALDYVRGLGAGEIRTGVLQHKSSSAVEPDYFAERITRWRWIIYPWAAHEDLVGFAEKVLCEDPMSEVQVGEELLRRYNLSLGRPHTADILAELANLGRAERKGSLYCRNISPPINGQTI